MGEVKRERERHGRWETEIHGGGETEACGRRETTISMEEGRDNNLGEERNQRSEGRKKQ